MNNEEEKIMDVNNVSKLLKKIFLIIFIIVFIGIGIFAFIFFKNVAPVDGNSEEVIKFVVENGWSNTKTAEELENKGLIRNAFIFRLYMKIDGSSGFRAGTYNLSKNMDVGTIIENLTGGYSIENESITIQFIEGKRLTYFASKIAEKFDYTEEEILAKMSDKDYLKSLIEKYWFIEEDILNENIMYPLEGYLFPDTYAFRKSSTIEDIIETLLDEMDKKLSVYKDEIKLTGLNVHGLLTMASMVELEAVTPEDRSMVASVFYNRLAINMTMGSDVTTYYSLGKDFKDKLQPGDTKVCNAYNTRGDCVPALPAGPICSPSYSSIIAAIEPAKTEYYYFVADTSNKVYFSATKAEINVVISDLKKKDKWPE